jgi:hypothetical protein
MLHLERLLHQVASEAADHVLVQAGIVPVPPVKYIPPVKHIE